jgi:hypothetical protein
MSKQTQCAFILSLLGAATAFGQSEAADSNLAKHLETAPSGTPNKFGLSYRAAFNVGVKFKNLGGFAPVSAVNPGPDTGYQVNRTYEDGYNLVDDNNNSYGDLHATRNWGYLNAGQVVDTADSRFVAMHVTTSQGAVSTPDVGEDVSHGFEINYSREFQDRGSWKWGIESAFGYMPVSVNDTRPLTATVNQLTHLFEVPLDEGTNERYVPDAPYAGSNSPGPLLGSEPTVSSQTYADGALISGNRRFDADIFGFKVGPYVEIPLTKKLSVNLSGGMALVFVSSDFSFAENVSLAGAVPYFGSNPTRNASGSDSESDLMLGGYLAGNLALKLDPNWTCFGGVQFQGAGSYNHSDSTTGKKAVLDLSQTVFATLGISYSF